MHLSRVRFTVGTLLFAVAAVAANCWGFRRFYETALYIGGEIPYRVLPAGVGILPLFNVALIGTWLFAAKRFRSLRHGRAANTRSSPPGVAYFSLHFLMLGGLVCLCMPDEILSVQDILDVATGYVAEGWGAVLGEPGGTVPWVVLDTLILGVLISGPPLFLSWIGRAIATRCAATLPRRRFRAMTCLVSFGFASAGLAIALTPQPLEEEREITLDFQVVDEVSGRPVAAAVLRMIDPFSYDPSSPPPSALTDADGRARLSDRFTVCGERNAFLTMGTFSPWGRWLEISAAGHDTHRIPLTDLLGPFADPVRPDLLNIALARGETRADSFRDLAGLYTDGGQGFGGVWFEIEPDGRFAWCAWGCVQPNPEEYGYLKRRGEEIELVPIPHPGVEVHPAVTLRYRAVKWGERLYLSVADDPSLREFCRESLTPNRPSHSEITYESLLRESDRNKPETGQPRLPPMVWVRYLIDEMSLHNENGTLRLTLGSLLPQIPREGRKPTTGLRR